MSIRDFNECEYNEVDLCNSNKVQEVRDFLNENNLGLERNIDYTVTFKYNNKIIGTCSKYKNVIKCFLVSEEFRGAGISNELLGIVVNKIFEEGYDHMFVFTLPKNIDIFKSSGFSVIAETLNVSLLENGLYNIYDYLNGLIKSYNINTAEKRGAIVMNCNPLTLGHMSLIEYASNNSKEVLIFLVEEDSSVFPFEDRFNIVKNGTKHLKNVKVVPSSEYIISSATFPTYFLKVKDDFLNIYTELDTTIFGEIICKYLNINTRYVGEEPFCAVTSSYNDMLFNTLKKYGVNLVKIKRSEADGIEVSASHVRKLLSENKFEEAKRLIPMSTINYLQSEKGQNIIEKLRGQHGSK